MDKKYDFLIVGAGLFGSTCARLLTDKGYKVLVIEKRNHIAGNIYTKKQSNIDVHVYGAHIFHTSNEKVWEYVNQFASFNNFINSPLANFKGEIYNLPFNMNTFVELWPHIKTAEEAKAIIENEKKKYGIIDNPKNLEEQAIMLVGTTIYKKLIKEYTEKQWNRSCLELPSFIIKRIPLRFTFDNNYFNDCYQGVPIDGYTKMIERMLNGVEVKLNVNFLKDKEHFLKISKTIIYTGPIDEFFDYTKGILEYRSLRFETEELNFESYQNNAVVNYTSHDVPYTRIIEHKFFNPSNQQTTIISKEYPENWSLEKERFYTVNDDNNNTLYAEYSKLANLQKNVYFGGRLGMYKYFDMDDTIEAAFALVDKILKEREKQ